MRAAVLTLTDAPSADAIATIEGGLNRYNREQAGYWDSRALAVLVSAPDTQAVVGEILGRTPFGLCFLDLVFLPERNAIIHQGRLDPGAELIGKPFTYATLVAKIQRLLRRAA